MPIEIITWYEGLPIQIFDEFHMNDVIVYLMYEDKEELVRIDPKDSHIKINSLLVTDEGPNKFVVSYQIDSKTYIKDEITVEGYAPKKYMDEEFQVVYIDNMGNRTDCTNDFYRLFSYDVDTLIISWTLFLEKVNELERYGEYELIAPKNSGLFHRYTTLWNVTCDNKDSIRAVLTKVFNKEEKEDGN